MLCVIPARGGSKRIPRKNIRAFLGKPIIAYSIEAARKAGIFTSVVISTDDDEIAAVAREFGADVPFMRPAALADDFTGTVPVVRHAVREMEKLGVLCEAACCLYPTAPFVTAAALQAGLTLLEDTASNFAFTVTGFDFPIQRALRTDSLNRLVPVDPDAMPRRSQDLEECWHDAGQFYWGTRTAWLDEGLSLWQGAAAIKLPRTQVQDIDTLEDWELAELLFRRLTENSHSEALQEKQ
ncbi:pseudaminic acid cytidylyltransferase [Radicibacter daui]|uniref:pseudaminic acid cytidylyltransferase n=1 Tax=Radicibacter daui TaxID=3064829 RepID=UPI004046A483